MHPVTGSSWGGDRCSSKPWKQTEAEDQKFWGKEGVNTRDRWEERGRLREIPQALDSREQPHQIGVARKD